jgi:uncharacterized coiled-coil DUF342 family protein
MKDYRDFEHAVIDAVMTKWPYSSIDYARQLAKALQEVGIGLEGPAETWFVSKELYDDVARGLQSNRDLAAKYEKERDSYKVEVDLVREERLKLAQKLDEARDEIVQLLKSREGARAGEGRAMDAYHKLYGECSKQKQELRTELQIVSDARDSAQAKLKALTERVEAFKIAVKDMVKGATL